VIHLKKDAGKEKGEQQNADVVRQFRWCIVAVTPGGIYRPTWLRSGRRSA
jgi:hypothetical protein